MEAIKRGQVQCNQERPKPGRHVRPGDVLVVEKGALRFELTVLALSGRRGSATVAQTLYAETAQSIAARQAAAAQRRAERESAPRAPLTRPDKHARERIRRLIGKA